MPRYIVGGFLAEALNLPDSEKVVLRLGGRLQSAPGRFHPWNGTCVWDEEFSLCLEIAASELAEATMQVEVLSLDRAWLGGEVATPLATGVLRLGWIQRTPRCHLHPRMRLPLKRKTVHGKGPVELHLGIYVVGPGDCGPEPSWMTSVGPLRWDLLTKPSLTKKRQVRDLPSSACLEFTMIALWDLVIPDWKALSVDDFMVDLQFLVEAQGDVDELVLLEDSMEVTQASSKWREMYPAPDSKVCLQLPRTHCLTLELPGNCDSAWLRVQVLVRRSGSPEKVFEAEATVPLQRGGWPKATLEETTAEERTALSSLEEFVSGRYAQVPLFPEHSRAAGMREGVDAFAIPGAVGSMKCGYRLSGVKGAKPAKAQEDLQSTEEETEVLPEPEEEKTGKAAAAHTHDHGYRKWETFVQEMEAKPKRAAPAAYEMLPEEVEESDVEESWEELLPSAPTCSELAELKEGIAGAQYMLHFYVHDAQLLEETQGELELEVLLGQNVAFQLSPGSGSSFQRQFRIKKELPIEFPRHSRLQLRLRNAAQVLGSAVLDLQDRQLVQSLREKEEVFECRPLWQQMRCVGSLQLWLRVSALQATFDPEKDLWPLPYRQGRVELRVILHEVLFSMASTATEAVAAVELSMPVERLHRCRLPSPQYSDVRPLGPRGVRAGVSFEWRCSFPLTVLLPSSQKNLVISIFEPKNWQLLGTAEFLVDGVLSQVAETSGRQDLDNIPVLTRNNAGVCGSLSLTVRAVPWNLAQDFPLQAGREPSAVPCFENRDPRSVLEDLCAERLVCDPPNPPTRSFKAVRPPIRPSTAVPRGGTRRRRWRWAAALAAAAIAIAALRKELMPRGRSSSKLCRQASPWALHALYSSRKNGTNLELRS